MTGLADSFQRPIDYLRISVTDRCNLRCIYCMPPEGVPLMRHEDILSFEEIHTIAKSAAELGISKVRLTGGEPLVRAGLSGLVRLLSSIEAIDDISLTTNGLLLARYAAELKSAGLHRVNVSLDTLRPERFKRITRGGRLDDVLEGIEIARSAGLNPVKLNMLVMAGVNDDELLDFATRTITEGWHVRFMERMPFDNGDAGAAPFISVSQMRQRLSVLGKLEPCSIKMGNGPAKYFRLPQAKGTVGFITPVSEHFCFRCNRLRLTADGKLRLCLLSDAEMDLKKRLRNGASLDELKALIGEAAAMKPQQHHLAEGYIPNSRHFSQVGG